MRSPAVAEKTVPVRYEPYNMGFAYAYIDGQWVECIADAFLQVHRRSEHEWNLILEEWREHLRQHNLKRVTLNGKLLAEFLRELEQDEEWRLQRQRDLEEQPQREALLLPGPSEIPAIPQQMEARTGEYRVARAKAQSELELQRLLGHATTEKQFAPPTPASEAKRGQNGRRIERAATRDSVRDQAPQASTSKCPFSGTAIESQAERYRSSGIARAECPHCHALRQPTISRNGTLRFPPHDKRKLQTPPTEPRWVQGSAGWEVIEGVKK